MVIKTPDQLDRATAALFAGRVDEAEALCQAIRAHEPEHPGTLHVLGLIALQRGDPAGSLGWIERAIAVDDADPSLHNSRGSVLFQAGRLAEAESCFGAALKLNPRLVEAHLNLGNTLARLGRASDAEASFRAGIAVNPQSAQLFHGLGLALRDQGRLDGAVGAFRHAIELAPDLLEAHYHLGDLLFCQMRLEEAEAAFRRVVTAAPAFVPAQVGLGQVLYNQRRLHEAVVVLEKAKTLAPADATVDYALRLASSALIPAWHFPMLADRPRNVAYQRALERAVRPGCSVLEIGTGSGLVAMMAARAGAGRVTTCEINPTLARVAAETIAVNGLTDRVIVVPKISTQLRVGIDLPEPADVLVSELINVGLLAPGMLATLRHAMTELVKPGAAVIPARATVYGCLINAPELAQLQPVRHIEGFDLPPFDRFRPPGYAMIDLAVDPHQAASAPFTALAFDFADLSPESGSVQLTVTATVSTLVHGVAFWFDLHLDDQTMYSSGSGARDNHWKQAIHYLPVPAPVTAGVPVGVRACYDNTRLWFELAS